MREKKRGLWENAGSASPPTARRSPCGKPTKKREKRQKWAGNGGKEVKIGQKRVIWGDNGRLPTKGGGKSGWFVSDSALEHLQQDGLGFVGLVPKRS